MDANALTKLVNDVATFALSQYATEGLEADEFAVTVGIFVEGNYIQADYRGDTKIYPASVVKLFYMVAAHRWLEDGKIHESKELTRALRDMIVDSSNDATHYVIDVITGTTSGPELSHAEMADWSKRRNAINDYFRSENYADINVNQKPWGEGPYGRESLFVGADRRNRNMLTTNATARLIRAIIEGRSITSKRSAQMMELLSRDHKTSSDDKDDQATMFTGKHLPADYQLWSKAGWTSATRHDAAYVEGPEGSRVISVVFTTNHSTVHDLVPSITSEIHRLIRD